MEIIMIFYVFFLINFILSQPITEDNIFLLSDFENYITEKLSAKINSEISFKYSDNKEEQENIDNLEKYKNLTLIDVKVKKAIFNNTELPKQNSEKQAGIDIFNKLDKEVFQIRYIKDYLLFEKELHYQEINENILFTYKGLIFTSNNNNLELYKFTNNFLIKKDKNGIFIQSMENCNLQGKLIISSNYILSISNNLCLYRIDDNDPKFSRIVLKNLFYIPNKINQQQNIIYFSVIKDYFLIVLKSSLVILDFQGQIKEEIRSFRVMSETFDLKINQVFLKDNYLYILSESYGLLVYSLTYPHSLKLANTLVRTSAINFKIHKNNILFLNSEKKGNNSNLEIINFSKNDTSFTTNANIYLNNPQSFNLSLEIMNFENFTILYSRNFKTLQIIDMNKIQDRSIAVKIQKIKLNEEEASQIKRVFLIKVNNEKLLGIVLDNEKVIFIKKLRLGQRKIEFDFKEKGSYDIRMKVSIQTKNEGIISLYINTRFNVIKLPEAESIYNESYIYIAFYTMLGILLVAILMATTSCIYTYFENRHQKNVKAGYTLTTNREKTQTNNLEDEKFTLDVELEIKAN